MRILLATHLAHPPQGFGGANISSHELAIALGARGNDIRIISRLESRGYLYYINRIKHFLTKKGFPQDKTMGYPVYRGWDSGSPPGIEFGMREVLSNFVPDVVLAQGGQAVDLALAAQALRIPSVVYLRDVEFNELPIRSNHLLHNLTYIANSKFTADKFKSEFGLHATVIPPLIYPSNYAVKTSGEFVLFINPHPKKGLHIAAALAAARPDIQFIFQESWVLGFLVASIAIN